MELAAGHNTVMFVFEAWNTQLNVWVLPQDTCTACHTVVPAIPPAGKALKGEDILVYRNKAADTTGRCYWNIDFHSEANKRSSHCVTHLVFLAIRSTIGVSLHHCQGVLAVKGCSGWSNRALCGMQALFLPLCSHEFVSEPCSFWPETWLHLRGQS